MKKYSHENWNQLLASPSCAERDADLRLIGHMALHNLIWFVRRCISLDRDIADAKRFGWEAMIEPTEFTKRRRKMQNEDSIG